MKTSLLSASLAVTAGVSALPQSIHSTPLAPALPLKAFDTMKFAHALSLDEILSGNFPVPKVGKIIGDITKDIPIVSGFLGGLFGGSNNDATQSKPATQPKPATQSKPKEETLHTAATSDTQAAGATCSNPRVRTEWDSYSTSDRQAWIDALKCLMGKPASGQFKQAKSRYEDLVALHQTLTPNVHGSSKFLLWHRYYLFTMEDMLRSECGFDRNLPWFDETKYAGKFTSSSIFSDKWLGSINTGGNCVTNGQFANLAINIGPGSGNQVHCLARNGDGAKTQYCNADYVAQCNAYGDFAGMAACAEGGPHAWGHNGIGAVMQDTYGSPSDPVFWLHHGFVDRNFRIWQNKDSARLSTINGNDVSGRPITLDTNINVYGIRPDVRVRDILDTTGTTLCYKYNY